MKDSNYMSKMFKKVYGLFQKNLLFRDLKYIMYYVDGLVLMFIKKPKKELGSQKKKVLVIYNLAFGDGVIFRCSAIKLKEVFNEKEYDITLMCQKGINKLYENDFTYDKIIPIDFNKSTLNLKERIENFRKIRSNYYDVIIDPVGIFEWTTNVLYTRAAVGDEKIGYRDINNSMHCSINKINSIYDKIIELNEKEVSLIEYYEYFIKNLGEKLDFNVGFEKLVTKKCDIEVPEKYFIIFPSASMQLKRWHIERYAEIAEKIYDKTGMSLLLIGTKTDEDAIEEFKKNIKIPYIDLVNKTSLNDYIEIIKKASLVVTNDTSAYHIAVIEEVPVAIITGGYTYYRYVTYDFKRKNEFKKPCIIVNKRNCFNCDNRCKYLSNDDTNWPCLEEITVNYAWSKIEKYIEENKIGDNMQLEILGKVKDITTLVFGDYMVDKYIIGNVSRISPEAPIPVINVQNETKKLGGAGNVINNIFSLGSNVKALGCIGNDEAGNFICDFFNKNNINLSFFKQYSELKTTIKTRVVSKNQQFIRIDEEEITPLVEDYFDYVKENLDDIFLDIDVLIISDYAKGSVTEKISQLLIDYANKHNIPSVVDPKGNDYKKYTGATICTPNFKELSDVAGKNMDTEEEIGSFSAEICERYNIKYLAVTRSEKGISLIDSQKNKKDFPAVAKEVIDVSGAGDTVVATVALMLAIGTHIEQICEIANVAASIVVSKFGTSTITLNELMCSLNISDDFKLQSLENLKFIAENLKEKNRKIVFTNGCFDMLHVGHLSSFKEAKKIGDILIVAVNSDESVKSYKGDLRPIISQEDRIEMLSAIEYIDYIVLMEDKDPVNIIKTIKPDYSIKGKDWESKIVPEKSVIESYGGEIKFINLENGKSTSAIIEKILKVYGK